MSAANIQYRGGRWFPFGTLAGTDFYPTNGDGLAGSGSLTSASDLREFTKCRLECIVITVNSTGGTFTIKDAAGSTIRSFVIPLATPHAHTISLGMNISGLGGFTIASDVTTCAGLAIYTRTYRSQS